MNYNGTDGLDFGPGNTEIDTAVLRGKLQDPDEHARSLSLHGRLKQPDDWSLKGLATSCMHCDRDVSASPSRARQNAGWASTGDTKPLRKMNNDDTYFIE